MGESWVCFEDGMHVHEVKSSETVSLSLKVSCIAKGHMAGVLARHCDEVTKEELPRELNSRPNPPQV